MLSSKLALSKSITYATPGDEIRPSLFNLGLKENLLWVRSFETIEQLRQALLEFRDIYNNTWLIERHRFITPAAFRRQQLEPVALAA